MGAVKSMIMDLEEKCFDQVAEAIIECDSFDKAQAIALKVFNENNLVDVLGADYLEESVCEMWNELHSDVEDMEPEEYWGHHAMDDGA